MKTLRKMIAVVILATMMTISVSFVGMAETMVETESNGSFETTDKTVDENDSVEFDEEDSPEVKNEQSEEVETTVSSGTVIEVAGQDDVSVSVDEIVVEKNNDDLIISSDSEINVETTEDSSSLIIVEKETDLESDTTFETTSKVVGDVDIAEFDSEPIENEVIVTPEVPNGDAPTDLPPEVVEPEVPQPEIPEPVTPQPEVPTTPEPDFEYLYVDRNDHGDYDTNDDYKETVYIRQVPYIPFVTEPSPRLTEPPVFVEEPTPSALPRTGDTIPISVYVFVSSLAALVFACFLWADTENHEHHQNLYLPGVSRSDSRMHLCSFVKLYSALGSCFIYCVFRFIAYYLSHMKIKIGMRNCMR